MPLPHSPFSLRTRVFARGWLAAGCCFAFAAEPLLALDPPAERNAEYFVRAREQISGQTPTLERIIARSWRGAAPAWNAQGGISLPIARLLAAGELKISINELDQRLAGEAGVIRQVLVEIEKQGRLAVRDSEHWVLLERETRTRLGDLEFTAKHFPKAAEIYRQVLFAISREKEPLAWAAAADNLQIALWQQTLFLEAEMFARQSVEVREQHLGGQHPLTALSLANRANILDDQGDRPGAETLYRRALEIQERLLGPEHPDTLATRSQLAIVLHARGQFAEAETQLQQVVDIQKRTLGEEHLKTLMSLDNLATVLWGKGDLPAAETAFRQLLTLEERLFGVDHRNTLQVVEKLSKLLREKRDLLGADALQKRIETAAQKPPRTELPVSFLSSPPAAPAISPSAPGVPSVTAAATPAPVRAPQNSAEIGSALLAKGEIPGAEKVLREGLESETRARGAEHPMTLNHLHLLSLVVRRKGDLIEAETLSRRALEGREKALGREHRETVRSMFTLATLYNEQQRQTEAARLASDAMEIVRRTMPADDLDRVRYEKQFRIPPK